MILYYCGTLDLKSEGLMKHVTRSGRASEGYVARVAMATPIFQVLFHKIVVLKWPNKKFQRPKTPDKCPKALLPNDPNACSLKIQKPKDLNAQISKSLKAFNLKLLTPSLHSVTRYIHNGGMSFYTWQQTIEIMAGCEGETKFLL